ncbi:MAG TPA: lactate permease LctP family transporter [Vicinamibacterales bacterium]|jgi:lactate permease
MWQQNYQFAGGNLALSAVISLTPLLVLFYLLGVRRKPAWIAGVAALATAWVVALVGVRMPVAQALVATVYGAAFGLFPIAWIMFSSILLYRIAVETGRFEVIKDSLGALTDDRRLQLLLVAFSLSSFIEGAAGFGTPVAISAAMLTGLGFPPFQAAVFCLLGNTAPVAFGSIGIPIVTLTGITGLPMPLLSAMTGRILSIVAVVIPVYLLVLMAGVRNTLAVWPALIACGFGFGIVQLIVSNFIGPELTDILAALASIGAMVLVLKLWKPAERFQLDGDDPRQTAHKNHGAGTTFMAWIPYVFLVVFVLLWGYVPFKALLDRTTTLIQVPGLHNTIQRIPPVTSAPAPYAAIYTVNWLSAAGTSCFLAAVAAALALGVGPRRFGSIYMATLRQLSLPIVTIAAVLALAYLMNYAGMTSTLGLAFAATGVAFPFFSATLGWLGVVLTGSVTSSNALFGNLQVVTATSLDMNPVLTASANASGGVMGKMISPQSIAVAVAATGMALSDEGRLFRYTLRHSLVLITLVGLIVLAYAYWFPGLVPVP